MAILSLVAIPSFASYRENASNAKDLQNARLSYNRLILEDREMSNKELHSLVGLSESDVLIINEDGSVSVNYKVYPAPFEHGEMPEYSDEELDDLIKQGYIPVATADELNNISKNESYLYGKGTEWEDTYEGGLNKKYVQVKNIDLSGYSEREGWEPIGSYTTHLNKNPFMGTYDGGNYVITDLEVKGDGKNYQGLFGYTEGATISNVGLTDNKATGLSSVGGLVGRANASTIDNSYATGSVRGSSDTGGLVGRALASSTMSNSYWNKETTGKSTSAGQDESFGKTTEEMKKQITYEGWDFSSVWKINEGEYPTLR